MTYDAGYNLAISIPIGVSTSLIHKVVLAGKPLSQDGILKSRDVNWLIYARKEREGHEPRSGGGRGAG